MASRDRDRDQNMDSGKYKRKLLKPTHTHIKSGRKSDGWSERAKDGKEKKKWKSGEAQKMSWNFFFKLNFSSLHNIRCRLNIRIGCNDKQRRKMKREIEVGI